MDGWMNGWIDGWMNEWIDRTDLYSIIINIILDVQLVRVC